MKNKNLLYFIGIPILFGLGYGYYELFSDSNKKENE